MDATTFKRILTTFADSPASVDVSKGKVLCEIRDEVIEANVVAKDGELFVAENGSTLSATKWLVQRVARLPILADRILASLSQPEYFIGPVGTLLDQIDSVDTESSKQSGDASTLLGSILDRRPVGSSSVVYLTSNAGEGKTTLITHLARLQAQRYKDKTSDWLLVPIALGGRPFLRFDDIVVGFLANRLRFPLYFFDAFVELVKLGVIVPAFDGFEEMFVQNAAGDALSAVGSLMRTLDSSGTVLIAARKAYFDYQDIRSQARLFDSLGQSSVVFSQLSLNRWGKDQFLDYCIARNVETGDQIYTNVSDRLGSSHYLLTRAVLVKRLLDVAGTLGSVNALLLKIHKAPEDYFAVFVEAIIEREAHEKWIDTSGDPAKPLLSVKEHFELLASIAQEMWNLSSEHLKADVIDLITDLFCEQRRLLPSTIYQIRERTKQHALIDVTDGAKNTFNFDHEEFRNFFLGEAVGRVCVRIDQSSKSELLHLLRKGSLPLQALQSAVAYLRRVSPGSAGGYAGLLQEIARLDGPSSFTQENVSKLILKIVNERKVGEVELVGLNFGPESLRDCVLTGIIFRKCSFGTSSLENCFLTDCVFSNCHFDSLNVFETTVIQNTILEACGVISITPVDRDTPVFEPRNVEHLLQQAGFKMATIELPLTISPPEEDQDVKLLRRFARALLSRGTWISEPVVLRKLGPGAESFIKDVIPRLVSAGILTKEWNPRDHHFRYRMGIEMGPLEQAMSRPSTNLESIITQFHPGG